MKSAQITPYLFFAGRCEEAIEFYGKTLGAEKLFLMYFKESPDPTPPGVLQDGFENKVMHATIRIGESLVMASDGCDDKTKFEGFRLAVSFPTEAEAQTAFESLSTGGQIEMPLTKTFWSPCFGMLTDKFGVAWMVSMAEQPPEK